MLDSKLMKRFENEIFEHFAVLFICLENKIGFLKIDEFP